MAKMRQFVSKLGFSILIPDGWDHVENLDRIDVAQTERESHNRCLLAKSEPDSPDKATRVFLEITKGLSTGIQAMDALRRKMYYDKLLMLCSDRPKGGIFDKSAAKQATFLLSHHDIALQEWNGKLTATRLLITLHTLTEDERLRAKECLQYQEGYFTVGTEQNGNQPNMTIVKFSTRENETSARLYSLYRQSLPPWFWSGIPDKIETVKSATSDNREMTTAEHYAELARPDSLSAYATRGATGWVIDCTDLTYNFHHYKSLFQKMIESFRADQTE
jgi:hypothetical protein